MTDSARPSTAVDAAASPGLAGAGRLVVATMPTRMRMRTMSAMGMRGRTMCAIEMRSRGSG